MAAHAALWDTLLPTVRIVSSEDGHPTVDVDEDVTNTWALQAHTIPLSVTVALVAPAGVEPVPVADPSAVEITCAQAVLTVGVTTGGDITALHTRGSGAVPPALLPVVTSQAAALASVLFRAVQDACAEAHAARQAGLGAQLIGDDVRGIVDLLIQSPEQREAALAVLTAKLPM